MEEQTRTLGCFNKWREIIRDDLEKPKKLGQKSTRWADMSDDDDDELPELDNTLKM